MLVLGFAATLLFLKPAKTENGRFQGQRKDGFYDITDDNAAIFAAHWGPVKKQDWSELSAMVHNICADGRLWETDLNNIPGFADAVTDHLAGMLQTGVKTYITNQSKVL